MHPFLADVVRYNNLYSLPALKDISVEAIFKSLPIYTLFIILPGGESYTGPFVGSATTCAVRVRAWRLSDWPKPDFTKSGLTITNGLVK